MSYLEVFPNQSQTNSGFSFNLMTYYGRGKSQEEAWESDDYNKRAPYSSNERFFEFPFDDLNEDENSGGAPTYFVVPNLKNTDPKGANLDASSVWYYNVPADTDGNPIGDFSYGDTYMICNRVNADRLTYRVSYAKTKEGSGYLAEVNSWDEYNNNKWFTNRSYETVVNNTYRTNIKWFTYKVYRVDPLTRENISESDVYGVDEPLLQVVYGASNDSLKCRLGLMDLAAEIKRQRGDEWQGYQQGEMYRIVFSVEEHLGYGYRGAEADGELLYDGKLDKASAESSILFRCVSKDEQKLGTYTDPNTGVEKKGYLPDFTPLQFNNRVTAEDYAEVKLVNGQTGLVDYLGTKVFDIYYQWWECDADGNDIRMIAGTDNIWIAQETSSGKDNHRPYNWVLNPVTGQGINGEQYYRTIDPNDPEAHTYAANGLPADPKDWTYDMVHMYTQETCGGHYGMWQDTTKPHLTIANNNAMWGNTDTCYIPAELAGKYIKVKAIAVNCQYPLIYDNLQTIESHAIKVGCPIDRVDVEVPIPYDTDTGSLSGTVTTEGAYLDGDYWSEVMADGTLRHLAANDKFEAGKKYRYTVELGLEVGFSYGSDARCYVNGNYTYKIATGKFYSQDITCRKSLNVAPDRQEITVYEGQKAEMRMAATGDGLTYHWETTTANAPYLRDSWGNVVGNYFATYSTGDTTGYIGTHGYKCTVTDRYGNSQEFYFTVHVVKNDDLYITPAYPAPGVNGSQLTEEEIMAKSNKKNNLSSVTGMMTSLQEVEFTVAPGGEFAMFATYTIIPQEFVCVRSSGATYHVYDEVDWYDGSVIRERTPIEGEITYNWSTCGAMDYMLAGTKDFTPLGTDSSYVWTVPTEPGKYGFKLEIVNTMTFSDGTTDDVKSQVYFYVNVSEDAGTVLNGTISSHGNDTDTATVELYKSGETTPVATQTVSGNKTVYSFTDVEAGTYTLKVTKACNQPYTAEIVVESGTVSHDVVMIDNHDYQNVDCTKPKTCTNCGKTFGAQGEHSYTDATCENPATCIHCGMTSGYALGHDWIEATCETPKTCATCGATEGTVSGHNWIDATCAHAKYCANCYETVGNVAAHSWVNADCNNPTYCSVCGETAGSALGHFFVSGACARCGVHDPSDVDPSMIPTLKGSGFTLSFEDEILVNFYYTAVNTDDILEQGMLVFYSDPGSADVAKADDSYIGSYVESSGAYIATTDGIAAKEMGDNRYYCAYAKLYDGTYAYSPLYQYSPKKYATNLLAKASTSAKQKALCVAMLNYGAAAQNFFGYKTDDLMNAGLTAEQKALVAAYDASYFTGTVPVDANKVGEFTATTVGFSGKSASVSFEGAFSINYYFTPNATADGSVVMYYWNPEDYKAATVLSAENATGAVPMELQTSGAYWAQVSGIAAKSLDDTYYVAAIYTDANGNSYCTGVIAYSLSRYCMNNAKPGKDMQELAANTAMYGYYAKQYFTT